MRTLLILLATLIVSCSEDKNQLPGNPTVGTWSLIHFSPGFAEQEYYQPGDILWEFNSEEKLIVKINVDLSERRIPIVEDGEYTIKLNSNTVELESIDYDYTVFDGVLTISDRPEVDGSQIEFLRVK